MKRAIQIGRPDTGEEEWMALKDVLEGGWLTQGPQVRSFEDEFSEMTSFRYAIAFNSCTSALHAALLAAGIGGGDQVLVPAFTWVATAHAVKACGAIPVFVDVDPLTFNLSYEDLEAKMSPQVKAVVPVDLFGLPCDVRRIKNIVGDGVAIVEDGACAAGSTIHGSSVGSDAMAIAFSFHPRKSITTGEGGMLCTNVESVYKASLEIRNHGCAPIQGPAKPYSMPDVLRLGFNYRMTDIQAAIGRVQLKKLDQYIDERSTWARWYSERLKGVPGLLCPEETKGTRHAWQSYVVLVREELSKKRRNEIMELLAQKQIFTRPGTHCVPALSFYKQSEAGGTTRFPQAWMCYEKSIALPLHNRMTAEDYEYVADSLEEIMTC